MYMSTCTIECHLLGLEVWEFGKVCYLQAYSKQPVVDKDGGGSVVICIHSRWYRDYFWLQNITRPSCMVPTTPCGSNNEHLYIRGLCCKQYTYHHCFYPYICRVAWIVSSGAVEL
jgi:hypothetical protein